MLAFKGLLEQPLSRVAKAKSQKSLVFIGRGALCFSVSAAGA